MVDNVYLHRFWLSVCLFIGFEQLSSMLIDCHQFSLLFIVEFSHDLDQFLQIVINFVDFHAIHLQHFPLMVLPEPQ